MTYNANRGKGKPAKKPYDFHPFAKQPARQATAEDLKRLFGGDKK